jgi:curved DNA-binding protein CbpA
MKHEFIDYYKVLGINQTSSIQEIKKSFRQKAKRIHPDVGSTSEDSGAAMKLLLKAYRVLSDPVKRREYDQIRRAWVKPINFDYREFLRKRRDDFHSQSKLVFYDLLHDNESDALSLFEELVYIYNVPIEHYLGREDFMDCAFLLAEEYEKKHEYTKAFELFEKIVLLEYEKPYFRHFFDEVIDRLRMIVCNRLHEEVDAETQLDYCKRLMKFNFSSKTNAQICKKIAELHLKMGNVEKARYYLDESLQLSPGISGVKKLKKKTAHSTI